MNEQILEFAKQTGLCDEDGDFFGGKISQYEKFAELIVRECLSIADKHGAYNVMDSIIDQFGVEE